MFRSFDWLNKLDLLGTIELVDGNVIDRRIGVTCLERVKLFVEFLEGWLKGNSIFVL